MKSGFEIRDNQGLDTDLQQSIDFTGSLTRISVIKSGVNMSKKGVEWELIVMCRGVSNDKSPEGGALNKHNKHSETVFDQDFRGFSKYI